MINLQAKAREMQQQTMARQQQALNRPTWKDRLCAQLSQGVDVWQELLQVMAEHPELSLKNNASILQYRLQHDIHDTQELLTFEEARELGGYVTKGAKAIPISRVKLVGPDKHAEGFETVHKFPAVVCSDLNEKRYRGRPFKLNPNNESSLRILSQALEGQDVSNPVVNWVVSERYNLHDEGEVLPAIPADLEDLEAVIAQLDQVQQTLKQVCRSVDQSVKYQRHPEWQQDQAPQQNQVQQNVAPQAVAPQQAPTPQQAVAPQQAPAPQQPQAQNTGVQNNQNGSSEADEAFAYHELYNEWPGDMPTEETWTRNEAVKIASAAAGLATAAAVSATKAPVDIANAGAADVVNSVRESRSRAAAEQGNFKAQTQEANQQQSRSPHIGH